MGNVFAINSSGTLRLIKPLSYEHRLSYEIVIKASSVANSDLMAVAVVDINVNKIPQFSQDSYVFNVPHNLMPGNVFGYVAANNSGCPWLGYDGYNYSTNTVSV